MNWNREGKILALLIGGFLLCYFLPIESERFQQSWIEGLALVRWYAREHVILCLVPAFFIAGAVGVFVSQGSVMKYLGANAPVAMAYGVASVSGTILSVCSCTVLPLFAGIYKMGAGLGPATAFLYSGPAINVLAIVLTARVLGMEMGVARAVGAIVFSVVIGLSMHFIFRKEELEKAKIAAVMPEEEGGRPLWKTSVYFAAMIGILIFANWAKPVEESGIWYAIYAWKWPITGAFAALFAVTLMSWFSISWAKLVVVAIPTVVLSVLFPQYPQLGFVMAVLGLSVITARSKGEAGDWFEQTWGFTKQIMPLLLGGVFVAGLLLGRPEGEGLIPSGWIVGMVGGNSFGANLFASVAGALMYFATLTEVPILEGLMNNGMGKGPALALLLAGPALSLPNMLVIRSVLGTKKTAVFILLVVVMATVSGMVFGGLRD